MADLFVLNVALHGRCIGTITLLPGDRTLFVFEQDYIDDPGRPTLSLSFKDVAGELIADERPTRSRVPPFFSNLLPEGALRTYLAQKAGINPAREFFLLWVLGRDLPGAVSVSPAEIDLWPPQKALHPSPPENSPGTVLRFSLAGVQIKFSAVMEAAGGLSIPTDGAGGSWIVKLPSLKYRRVPENEFAMLQMAAAVGIDVPETKLVPLKAIAGLPTDLVRLDGKALAVKRFDRLADGRAVHMEDFAQVFGLYPEKKYERASYRNIAEVLWAESGEADIVEFVRRLVFNALIGNADTHLKNWSLIYPDGITPALAPAYDFVSTIAYLADTNMALTLGRSKNITDVSLEQLTYFSAKAGLPAKIVLNTATQTVTTFLEKWQECKAAGKLDPAVFKSINTLLLQIPLVREAADPAILGRIGL